MKTILTLLAEHELARYKTIPRDKFIENLNSELLGVITLVVVLNAMMISLVIVLLFQGRTLWVSLSILPCIMIWGMIFDKIDKNQRKIKVYDEVNRIFDND